MDIRFIGMGTSLLLICLATQSSISEHYISKKEYHIFLEQKKYIESHTPKTEIEDAALTAKKIELNEWLYDTQYEIEKYGFLMIYIPDELREMEPIK